MFFIVVLYIILIFNHLDYEGKGALDINYLASLYKEPKENNPLPDLIESFVDWDDTVILDDDYQVVDNQTVENTVVAEEVPATATEVIQAFFSRLSDRKFDEAFDLMIPVLRNSSEIRDHFTSFRMNPLLDWIEWWKLVPLNFEYVKSPAYWKDVYKFDLSYVMSADKTKYDETWEFTVNSQWNEPKISSIRCTTNKCSYHPIFWPENFGLMR